MLYVKLLYGRFVAYFCIRYHIDNYMFKMYYNKYVPIEIKKESEKIYE